MPLPAGRGDPAAVADQQGLLPAGDAGLDNGNPYPGYGIAFLPIPGGSPDGFNRPAGHPHYGMPREYSEQAG